jgi:sugar lactone lactonase YvrE
VTTVRGEAAYTSNFSSNLPASIDMGFDTYNFTPADVTSDESAISVAQQNQHQIYFEEFAPQRWLESGAPGVEQCAIKGCYSCDWQTSQNDQNFMAAYLPFTAAHGAISASLFPSQILAGCSPTYPDNCQANSVIAAASVSFLAGNQSALSQKLATLMMPGSGAPATITKSAGDGQSTNVGQPFNTALAVTVTNGAGGPVAGASVTFTVTPGLSGAGGVFSGTGPVVVSTDQNGNAAAPPLTANNLPGQFTVTATVNSLTATFTLSNLGYTLGTASALVGSTAGNGTVLLSGYGAWTAASNDSWLHVATASGSGSRSALIQFSYDANGSPAVQTGTITIAGLAFTVTQAGAGYEAVYPVTGVAWPGLNLPHGIAVDAQGNIYAADSANNAVKQWNATNGQVTALVSSGLSDPTGVAVDTQGNVYIADSGNNAIREWVAATQQVTTLVSSGLSNPTGVAVDAVGNVYIADSGNQAVKEWNAATAQVSVLAASGLQSPAAVAVDAQGNIYIADSANNMVFEWNATAGLTPLISGLSGPAGVTVDGQADVYIADTGNNAVKQWSAATQQVTVLISSGLNGPSGLAVDQAGNVYLADTGHNAIDRLSFAYLALGAAVRNESAAGGADAVTVQVLPATTLLSASSDQAWLRVTGVAGGSLNFSFAANISPLSRTGHITVLGPEVTVTQAGDAPAAMTKAAGDGQSTAVGQAFATSLAVSITDTNGIPLPGVAVTFSVTGGPGASGTFASTPAMPIITDQNGSATAPVLTANNLPGQFTVTATTGGLSAAFTLSNLGYTLAASSATVSGAAGNGAVLLSGYGPWTAVSNAAWLHVAPGSASGGGSALIQFSYDANGGAAAQTGTMTIAGLTFTVTQAGNNYVAAYPVSTLLTPGLNLPRAVAVDAQGNVYIADAANNVVDQWNATTGQMTALVSSGLNGPAGVAVDGQGNVYIADTGNNAIREWVASTQQVSTLVSSGLSAPSGLAVDALGNVYFADSGNQAVKEWNAASQQVSVLVGNGLKAPAAVAVDGLGNLYIADSGSNTAFEWNTAAGLTPLAAGLSDPTGVAVDGQANIYIADTGNSALKRWSTATQQLTVLISSGLNGPAGLAVDSSGNVYLADTGNHAIREVSFAFVGPASLTEAAPAGADALLPVLPASISLAGIFAPSSDQGWLTIGTIANGVVNFSFTANTSTSARTAHITLLGQQIPVTQNGLLAQTITFGALSNQAFGTAPFLVSATASSGLAVSFASTTPAVCTLSSATVTLVAAGACTIQATQAGNVTYAAATPVSQTFQVTPGQQTINFGALAGQTFGATPFGIGATASSGLAVSFASTTPAVCTVSAATVTLASPGVCTIQATQAGNANWTAATPVNQSFQVAPESQTITFAALSNHVFGSAPFKLNATASSGLAVSFASTTLPVCTVSSGTVTLVNGGTCTIQATQAGNTDWAAAPPVNQSFQVTQASQTITFGILSNHAFGTAPFTVSAPASSGLPVSFASTTSTVCTVSGTSVTLVAVGPCTIQATQAGNADYAAANPVNRSFQVTRGTQTITFGALGNQAFGTAPFAVSATANSGLRVGFNSQNTLVCTVSAGTVTLVAVGTCTIQATQAGNSNWLAATSVNQSFQVTQGSQTITFAALSNRGYGTAPFKVSATASSGLAVSFASTTPAVCTMSGATVTLAALGTCTIQATQAGNSNWAAAPPVNQSFQVIQGSQTITFGTLSNQAFGTAPFTVSATASSGLAVTFSSTTPATCTVSGATVTLVAVGSCTIQAAQAGNVDWAAATPVSRTFQVTRGTQTIAFGALANQTLGSGTLTVSATATSGLAVSFNSQTTKVCKVSGTTVTLNATGTCTIQATQAGNSNWAAATPVNQSFQVIQKK